MKKQKRNGVNTAAKLVAVLMGEQATHMASITDAIIQGKDDQITRLEDEVKQLFAIVQRYRNHHRHIEDGAWETPEAM